MWYTYFYLDWGISSVGRATGWQPVGQRFEPAILHPKDVIIQIASFFYGNFDGFKFSIFLNH